MDVRLARFQSRIGVTEEVPKGSGENVEAVETAYLLGQCDYRQVKAILNMSAEEVYEWLILGLRKWQKEEKERRMAQLENEIDRGE